MTARLSAGDFDATQDFFDRWVRAHIVDAERVLRMPVIFAEFGLSDKKPGFTEQKRDAFFGIVYDQVYQSALKRGAGSGALMWQLLPLEMSDWNDGYGLAPVCGSSISNVMLRQSVRLRALRQPMCGIDEGLPLDTCGNVTPHVYDKGLNQILA